MTKFFLRCMRNSHTDIELPNLVPIIVGRSPLTKITNRRVSKRHLKLIANFAKDHVLCENIGQNSSRINEKQLLKKSETVSLDPDDKIEILGGNEIVFIASLYEPKVITLFFFQLMNSNIKL